MANIQIKHYVLLDREIWRYLNYIMHTWSDLTYHKECSVYVLIMLTQYFLFQWTEIQLAWYKNVNRQINDGPMFYITPDKT